MEMAAIVSVGVGVAVASGIVAVHQWQFRRAQRRNAQADTAQSEAPACDPNTPRIPVDRVFTDKATFGADPEGQTVEIRRIADLVLATGRIVACDPLVFPETRPFTRLVPPGEYPVEVSIARQANGDERIAAARVVFRSGRPAQWEHALTDGQQLKALRGVELFGYGVDAGIGCFMDEATGHLLLAAMNALRADQNYYDDVLATEMDQVSKPTRDWASHRPDPAHRDNVVAFSSGWGDGVYSSWWALDSTGQLLALVTDFDVIAGAPPNEAGREDSVPSP